MSYTLINKVKRLFCLILLEIWFAVRSNCGVVTEGLTAMAVVGGVTLLALLLIIACLTIKTYLCTNKGKTKVIFPLEATCPSNLQRCGAENKVAENKTLSKAFMCFK